MKKLIYILVFHSIAFCDFGGGYAGSILRHGSSAREISLANSLVATENSGFNAFSNPSILGNIKNLEFGTSVFSLSHNRNLQAISICKNLPPSAGAGISFLRGGMDSIVGINSDEFFVGDMNFSEGYLMLSFGVKLNRLLSFGINGKSLFQRYSLSTDEKYMSRGISLDFGIRSNPFDNIDIGIQIESLFGEYNWNQSVSSSSVPYRESIPKRYVYGLSYYPTSKCQLLFQGEHLSIPDGYMSKRLSGGLEYQLHIIDNVNPIFLRFGLKQTRWLETDQISVQQLILPSAGIGIVLKLFNKFSINLDYAIHSSNIGINNLFSFNTEI